MVSPKLAFMTVMAFSPFFFMFGSEGTSSSSSSSSSSVSHVNGVEITACASQKVDLSVYYESLCQSCAIFIVEDLVEIFNEDVIAIVNLHLVPWANSHINSTNNTILCQNGPDECDLNSVEACVLTVSHDVNKHYALIYCFEFLAIEGRQKKWESCFSELGLPKEPILDCYYRGNGKELQPTLQLGRNYVSEIARLNPPLTFLPWVVVNNRPIGTDYANFMTYVCEAYEGPAAPPACNQQPSLETKYNARKRPFPYVH